MSDRSLIRPGPVLFVLVPALALVAIGIVGLWSSVQQAERSAAGESTRAALATARGLASAIRDRALLDDLPAPTRFELRDDALVPPADWRAESVLRSLESLASASVRDAISEALILETRDADRTTARRRLDEALARQRPTARAEE